MNCNNNVTNGVFYPVGEAPAQLALQKDLIINKFMNESTPLFSFTNCVAMSGACRQWRKIIRPELLSRIIFGKKQWEKIQGVTVVSDEPQLTEDQKSRLIGRFAKKCPFFNEPDPIQAHRFQDSTDNSISRTFKVIFIPEMVNGEDGDINHIGKVFSFEKTVKPINDNGTGFQWLAGDQNSDFRKEKVDRSYFLEVSLDVVSGSRRTTQAAKEQLLKDKGYRLPNPREAAIMMFVLNIEPSQEGGGFFYGREGGRWFTYMATDTEFNGGLLVVGAASSAGSRVDNPFVGDSAVGGAAVAEVVQVLM